MERVRRELLTDLRRAKDDPTVVAERLTSGLVFGQDTGYGHHVMGTETAVAALARSDVLTQFQRGYGPALATLIVVGDVSLDEVLEQAEAHLGDWTGGPEIPPSSAASPDGLPTAATIYLVDQPEAAQSVIRTVHPTVARKHPDYFGLTLVNHAFGGQFSARLNQNLRQDKGYSYGFNSSIQWYRGTSLATAGGSVQTAVTKESVQETLKEFHDIHGSRPISKQELEIAKAATLQGYPASFERPGMVLNHLIQMVIFDLPDDYFWTVRPGITAVSLKEARRIATERIRPDELQILVVGDRQTVEPGLLELGIPVVNLDSDGVRIG